MSSGTVPLTGEKIVTLAVTFRRRWWNWQRAARIAWIVLALVLLVNFVASIPVAYQLVGIVCASHW